MHRVIERILPAILVVAGVFGLTGCSHLQRLGGMPEPSTVWDAAYHLDLNAMRELLEAGADPDEISSTSSPLTPLMLACSDQGMPANEDLDSIVALLIEHGANVNAQNSENGYTALYYASMRPMYYSLCKLLVDHGANLEIASHEGKTPLMNASESGGVETAQLLLNHGAEVNRTDDAGYSALCYAVSATSFSSVPILLAYGADATVVTGDGKTVLALWEAQPGERVNTDEYNQIDALLREFIG